MATPSVSLATVQLTVARAIERFPRERARIERGAALLALGHVEQLSPAVFTVRSQTDDDVNYTVTSGDGCPCVDSQRHPGQNCKHLWAVNLLLVAEERERRLAAREREQAARAAVSADTVALTYARRIGWAA